MDVQDKEAPLQQHSDSQCHTDLPNLPYAAAGHLEEAVAVSDEGAETLVTDVAGDEMIEEKGSEGIDVDDVALETVKVEEEPNLAIDAEDDEIGDGNTNEDALMEEEQHQQGEEEEEEEQQQGEGEEEEEQQGDEEEEGEQQQVDEEEEGGQQQGDEEEEGGQQQGDEEEEEERQGEEEDGDGGMAMAEDTEEKSAAVSGGKRRRGAGKNAKATGRVASRKKMEEDVCFICFDGGDLVLCDRRSHSISYLCPHLFLSIIGKIHCFFFGVEQGMPQGLPSFLR